MVIRFFNNTHCLYIFLYCHFYGINKDEVESCKEILHYQIMFFLDILVKFDKLINIISWTLFKRNIELRGKIIIIPYSILLLSVKCNTRWAGLVGALTGPCPWLVVFPGDIFLTSQAMDVGLKQRQRSMIRSFQTLKIHCHLQNYKWQVKIFKDKMTVRNIAHIIQYQCLS